MAQSTLFVMKRNGVGKGAARKIRREGFIPAVLYGREMEPISLTVNPIDLKKALSTEAGENTLLELHVKGNGEEITKIALLRDVQYDNLTSQPIHFDFQEILRLWVRLPEFRKAGFLRKSFEKLRLNVFPPPFQTLSRLMCPSLGLEIQYTLVT
jgi:ribosomal protein L25 (general stress protein Ctc)